MNTLLYFALFAVFSAAAGAEEIILSGGGGGGATISCTPRSDGVMLQYNPGSLVRTVQEGQKTGFERIRDDRRNKEVWTRSSIPDGTTIYIFGLAKDWGKMATNVDGIETGKALASGKYQGGVATITLQYRSREGKPFTHIMANAVAVLPDGTHAWSGVDGTRYSVDGPNGPYLLIPKSCAAPSVEAIQSANMLESSRN
jgi:hypothetical protein